MPNTLHDLYLGACEAFERDDLSDGAYREIGMAADRLQDGIQAVASLTRVSNQTAAMMIFMTVLQRLDDKLGIDLLRDEADADKHKQALVDIGHLADTAEEAWEIAAKALGMTFKKRDPNKLYYIKSLAEESAWYVVARGLEHAIDLCKRKGHADVDRISEITTVSNSVIQEG